MRILVLGSGAREHALAWKLAASPKVRQVFVGPGNGGSSRVAVALPEVDPGRFPTVLQACRANSVDCVLVGPEAPLAAGVVDFLRANGVPAIGPCAGSAQLEASKVFAKEFLLRNHIPTAEAVRFSEAGALAAYLAGKRGRVLVVKKSGLAAGKGVLVSADTEELARFGTEILARDELLVEECLEGWEVSVFGLSDGGEHVVLPPCTDYKRAHDGDKGPNTGGMGSICPVPSVDQQLLSRIVREVVDPTYAALRREGLDYAGVLYFGLMVTPDGPKVLEYNVRFGDPETQVLMPVAGFDLGELAEAMLGGTLSRVRATSPGVAEGEARAALGVVVAARGYPLAAAPKVPVEPIPDYSSGKAVVFHASTVREGDGRIFAGGGRCFTVVGLGTDLAQAHRRAYEAVSGIRFEGAWWRSDIGRPFVGGGR